jgi:uncharacterized Fe-S cluster-containing radical SAM superfamily enzyme
MGVRTPETCWAVNKRQVINWRNFYNWLVELFELSTFFLSLILPNSDITLEENPGFKRIFQLWYDIGTPYLYPLVSCVISFYSTIVNPGTRSDKC